MGGRQAKAAVLIHTVGAAGRADGHASKTPLLLAARLGATRRSPSWFSHLLFAATLAASAFVSAFQAFRNAPTSDELAHLVSGVATVRTGDPAFYRVNPPLHRLLSGLAVEAVFRPELRGLYYPSMSMSGSQQEVFLVENFVRDNPRDYRSMLILGRLVRIPIVLLSGFLFLMLPMPVSREAARTAALLWWTSPMGLGHGWLVMPDALSGSAMILLIVTTARFFRQGRRKNKFPAQLKFMVS